MKSIRKMKSSKYARRQKRILRCIQSGKIANGKDIVIVDYAEEYLKQKGYIVKQPYIKVLPYVLFILALVLVFTTPFASAIPINEYRWSITSDCVNVTGEPDGIYNEIGLGVTCNNEDFNLTGITDNSSEYNISFVYVFNVSQALFNDEIDISFCDDSPACSINNLLITYDVGNTPVDFLDNYSELNQNFKTFEQLENLRLNIDYVRVGGQDSNSFVDAIGIFIIEKRVMLPEEINVLEIDFTNWKNIFWFLLLLSLALILNLYKSYLYGGALLMLAGLLMLFNEVNIIISLVVIILGFILLFKKEENTK